LVLKSYGLPVARPPRYPFEPRSTAYLRPGDFWGIRTRRGGWYCCGRVLATDFGGVAPSRSIVVGLLDWCEPDAPTADAIAGALVLAYGLAHVKTIRETGGQVLGHRPLEADGGLDVLLGGRTLSQDWAWGYMMIEAYAHDHFGRHFPERPEPAVERPVPLRNRNTPENGP
jgi:hypothetical protein